jgi:DNA-binding transcriptional ArsR family regulator
MSSQPYVPYGGTAGWSETDTSQERALFNLRTGREYNNQQKALALIKQSAEEGLTWKELSQATDMHHGTATGVLTVLYKSGAILRTNKVRNRCRVYMDISFTDTVFHIPFKEKEKLCPHCGLDTKV